MFISAYGTRGLYSLKLGQMWGSQDLAKMCLIFIFELHRSYGHTKAQGIQHGF